MLFPEYSEDEFSVEHITLDDPRNAVVFYVADDGEVRVYYDLGQLLSQFSSLAIDMGLTAATSEETHDKAYALGVVNTVQAISASYFGIKNEYNARTVVIPDDISGLTP